MKTKRIFLLVFWVVMICFQLSPALCANFTGNWSGTWDSDWDEGNGGVSANVTQTGTSLTGTLTITNTGCDLFTSNLTLTGSVSGDVANFHSTTTCYLTYPPTNQELKYTNGTISGNTMTGDYERWQDGYLDDAGTFSLTRPFNPFAPIVDFNGDGKTDIPWRHKTDGRNSVWLMNGTTWSSTVSLPGVADTNWEIVGAGDFNNDGKTDILWRHKTDGRDSVWLMNGTTWSSSVSLPGVADANWQIVGAGDFNNDGRVDVLWRHKTDGRDSVWLMNGTTWSSSVSLPGVADANWEIVGP